MYKKYTLNGLEKFLEEEYPTKDLDGNTNGSYKLTIGQVILSTIMSREDRALSPMEWLFGATDEDFYTALQNAMENERE